VTARELRGVIRVAEELGDGCVHLTSRANLQLRGLPGSGDTLDPRVLDALEATGLLPSRTHELVRNIMASPLTGISGGRADLRPVARQLDLLLRGTPELARLTGRFLFVLDDGRGDLADRTCDLGLVALDGHVAQPRIGDHWGQVVALDEAPELLTALAALFVTRRGTGSAAPWHVNELDAPLVAPHARDPRHPDPSGPLPFGEEPWGRHVPAPDGLDAASVAELTAEADELVVTPWRGIVVPGAPR
jgi:precorrin-3B synthase